MMVQARVQCLVRVRGNEQGCVLNVSLTVESKKKRKEEMLQKCTFGCSKYSEVPSGMFCPSSGEIMMQCTNGCPHPTM